MYTLPRSYLAVIAVAVVSCSLSACGSGGKQTGTLTGSVTDVDGRSVAGATVSVGSRSTVSASNGSFSIDGVGEGYPRIVASATVNGRRWSGETVMDLVSAHQNRSANVVISDDRFHATLRGTVIDPSGFVLEGAKVFIGGPFGSTLAVTDRNGNYEANRLTPSATYTVTCSLAGFKNDTRSVHLDPNDDTLLSFALAAGSNLGTIAGPTGLIAQAWTVSETVSRSAKPDGRKGSVYDWLRHHYRHRRGITDRPIARFVERKPAAASGRSAPPDSLVEIDLFWDYASDEQLFGYAIKRALSQAALPGADVTAVLRDPLAAAFFDADPFLTPDVPTWYTVHRLDTVSFPASGAIGSPSNAASANPLSPIRGQSPGQNQEVSGTPTFRWNAVNGAAAYQLYVWDEFPSLMFDANNPNEPGASQPIWPLDPNNPGNSLIVGPATSAAYGGPALTPGKTYYWLVVALDSANPANLGALSASQIAKFVKR